MASLPQYVMASKGASKSAAKGVGKPLVDEGPAMVSTAVLIDAVEMIELLAGQQLLAPLAAKVVKIMRWIAPINSGYSNERMEIIRRYGVDVGGNQFNIPGENAAKFNAELQLLRNDLTAAPPRDLLIDISMLADIKMTPKQYSQLMIFIRE